MEEGASICRPLSSLFVVVRGDTMVALVLLSAAASTAFAGTCLNAADLWRTLKGDTRYLSTGDRRLVKSSLEVLLAKVSVAERAERAQPHTLTPGVVIDDVLPRSPPAEALLVLSAVRTAKDLLKLRCDAATVTAALLSQVLTERAPTWPASRLPPIFMAEVSTLLSQQHCMRALGAAASDLDDAQADAVRRVLSRGLQVEAGSKTKSSRAQASQADMEAKDYSAVVIDAATDDAETLITTASFETVETDVSLSENTEVLSLDIGQRVAALTAGRTGMDFAEFVAAVRSSDGFYSTRQLQALFFLCDADESGTIDSCEAQQLLARLRDHSQQQRESDQKQQQQRATEGQPRDQEIMMPTEGEQETTMHPWSDSQHSGAGDDEALSTGDGRQAPVDVDPRALVVLLGSALVGLRASDALPSAQRHAKALEAVQLFAPLAHSVGLGSGVFSELESLSYARLFPESLRRLRRWYLEAWPDAETLIPHLCETLEAQLKRAPSLTGLISTLTVSGRVKSVTSTFRKVLRDQVGGKEGENVRDALALRVILVPAPEAAQQLGTLMRRPSPLDEVETEALVCFGVYRQMLRLWPEVQGRFKDFVTRPKPNGYQSLHTNVCLDDGREVEVQIRTLQMHERAEYGSASHNAYRAAQLGASAETAGSLAPLLLQSGQARMLPPAAGSPDFRDWAGSDDTSIMRKETGLLDVVKGPISAADHEHGASADSSTPEDEELDAHEMRICQKGSSTPVRLSRGRRKR